MANIGVGVTIGSHSLRAIKVRRKGEGYVVQRVFADRLDEAARPVAGRALAARGLKGARAAVGLTGRDVIIRYTQVPPVPEWRLKTLMKFEIEEVGSQSGGDVCADYRVLDLPDPDGTRADQTILVAMARNRHVDALIQALDSGGLKLDEGVPNSVALFNSFACNATYTEEETALLVNIGAENVDLAVQRGGELLFARNSTPGGKAFTEAIAKAFSTTEGKAEKMKVGKADVTPKGQARYDEPAQEKVANAIMGVAGQLASLIQSTLMIARAQTRLTDLKIDRVLLTGGGATLKGLDLYLKQAMGVPVERYNPFALCDLSGLTSEERTLVETAPHEFAVALGLAQNAIAPEAFRLSILPAALRRVRDFAEKGVYAALAGVVMLGALFLLYQGRKDAAGVYQTRLATLTRAANDARARDSRVRTVLKAAQEQEVRHVLLAELAGPGRLLADALAEVERHTSPHVYIHTLKLNVAKPAYHFEYVMPKNPRQPSGYVKVERDFGQQRVASVELKGRISGGENPAAIFNRFVEAMQANARGLDVRTRGTLKRVGTESEFDLEILPGVALEPESDKGSTVVLREMQIEEEDGKPVAFVGRRADGVRIRVPFEQVQRRQREELVKDRRTP